MAYAFHTAAILGATGPTGTHLARELMALGAGVRVVSRSMQNLLRCFPDSATEKVKADMLDPLGVMQAIEGCDLVFDCIGLPADRLAEHPRTAQNIADAVRRHGARCVHVSGYWGYLPIRNNPVSEAHPRTAGPWPATMRREAEDILRAAGAAVVNLPDFYGPDVHTSTLQRPLGEAVAGKTSNWIGSLDSPREYIYVPDAMKAVARLAEQQAAYGKLWIVPGPGPITPRRVLAIAGRHLGQGIRARGAGTLLLQLLAVFRAELRAFRPMLASYVSPVWFDGSKLRGLLGEVPTTPYEKAIPRTLDWLSGQLARAR